MPVIDRKVAQRLYALASEEPSSYLGDGIETQARSFH
jgi:hypothetical protein